MKTASTFVANQVLHCVRKDEVPIFIFKGFRSQCNGFPGINYELGSKSNVVTPVPFFPNGILLAGNEYQISLNSTKSGVYSAFIIASQGRSKLSVPISLEVQFLDEILEEEPQKNSTAAVIMPSPAKTKSTFNGVIPG